MHPRRALGPALWIALAALAVLLTGCGNKYPNCDNDKECREYGKGENYCVDKKCAACRDDSHCGEGRMCRDGGCVGIPGYCRGDADCPAPGKCRDNRCGSQCLGNDECANGEVCQNGRCLVPPECQIDSECGDGRQCRSGRCVEIPAQSACPNRQFRTVYFDFDEHTLTQEATQAMGFNLTCANEYPGKFRVEGHCDERGTEEYNLALGERRAKAAAGYLQKAGVDKSRLRTVTFGESRPVDSGSSESSYARNRRAEFIWE